MNYCGFPFKVASSGKRQTMLIHVTCVFGWVKFVVHLNYCINNYFSVNDSDYSWNKTLFLCFDAKVATVRASIDNERAVSYLEVSFKTQVQEWKNTLLRGKDQKALDKHWNQPLKL